MAAQEARQANPGKSRKRVASYAETEAFRKLNGQLQAAQTEARAAKAEILADMKIKIQNPKNIQYL